MIKALFWRVLHPPSHIAIRTYQHGTGIGNFRFLLPGGIDIAMFT